MVWSEDTGALIIESLKKKGDRRPIAIAEIGENLPISERTIRRELLRLVRRGAITRSRPGLGHAYVYEVKRES